MHFGFNTKMSLVRDKRVRSGAGHAVLFFVSGRVRCVAPPLTSSTNISPLEIGCSIQLVSILFYPAVHVDWATLAELEVHA